MPPPPPSFASAAAGNSNHTPTRDSNAEWPRRTNGATQTFRRPSGTSNATPSLSQDLSNASQPPPRYVPPHRNGTLTDARYSKDHLIDLFKTQNRADFGPREDIYVGGWHPDVTNGGANASWGRAEQSRDAQSGVETFWDQEGNFEPLGLVEMDDEERELFSTSVNTPLKPPASTKENQQSNGQPGRKISISGLANTPGGYGPLSPTTTRGSGRRRETSESFFQPNQLSSPTTAGFNRDEQRAASPPPSLLRRRTDLKDANKSTDRDADGEDKSAGTPFGSLKRNPTAGPLNAGFGTPSSPWSNAPPSAGLSPMGSFGNFGLGQQGGQSDKRPGLGSGRAESRFKNLLNKDSGDESSGRTVERKSSMSSLSKVGENETWRPHQLQDFGGASEDIEEELPSGSAALAADADLSPPHQRQSGLRGFGTPNRSESRDDFGFGAFGMTSDNAAGFGQGFVQQTPIQQHQMPGNEPMSPADTNPYRSPEQHAIEHLTDELEGDGGDSYHTQLPGLGGFGGEQPQHFGAFGGLGALPNLGRAPGAPGPASDRSQTSSAGPNRGFPSLGGLGSLGGVSAASAWPVTQGGLGTPSRQTAGLAGPFGGGIFASSMSELQSPGLAGLGGSSMLSPQSGMGSRMTSMFPSAMQEQFRQGEQDRDASGERGPPGNFQGIEDFGRPSENSFGLGDPLGGQSEQEQQSEHQAGQFGAPGQLQPPIGQSTQQQQDQSRQSQISTQALSQAPGSSASNQPPAPQQRTMVMPDRMRWIYKDPQSNTQGPWSGLEMHDWYKAGFFSPELLVKKYEEADYEPLAQLIRRIGNSREPFLVPQIGIPWGPASSGPNTWAGSNPSTTAAAPPTSSGGAQPPFASSFPSFGTTLTAEQQNALERRKQEEQYLMARQKEHLAQAQIASRMQHHQMPPGSSGQHGNLMPGQLHHHGSAQSLHSQPSYGSITSPSAGAYQPSPNQAPQGHQPGFFDNSFRTPGQAGGLGAVGAGVDSLGHIREEEIPGIMDRLDIGSRNAPGQFGAPGQPSAGQQQMQSPSGQEQHDRQIQQMLQDRARLQQEQALHEQSMGDRQPASNERLQQFHQLQGQGAASGVDARFQPAMAKTTTQPSEELSSAAESSIGSPVGAQQEQPQELSLTQQVQAAASAQHSPAPQQPGFPQPFPPAPSQSPLPAPAAQRTGRQSVADQLQTDQHDLSQTPSTDTPTVAPWAQQQTEAPKGPSLKEIQELEAKKAADAEILASAARRAAFQKEMEAQAQAQAVAPAPGLPASASWAAAGGSPATPIGTSSPWAKAAQKPSGPTAAKTMAQIQKEEEERKRKRAAAAASAQATAMAVVANPAGGKSYANLAGKISAPPGVPSPASSAWTTVGASGKTKTPAVAPAQPATRAASSGVVPTLQSAATTQRKAPARSATMMTPGGVNAQEEFRKWAVNELRPDLNKGISADEFVTNLVFLPPDSDMLTEAVHSASSTIDSRHFADEFIRRKKLADKGLIDTSAPPKSASPSAANVGGGGGGWSEVAKKGPQKPEVAAAPRQETNGSFTVVPAKKKGGKR